MPDDIVSYYDQTAAQYDELHGGEQNLEHIRALEKAWPILDHYHIGSALDVGCGTGRSLEWLRREDPELTLVGIDPSEGLLKIARDRLPGVRLEVGFGESLPLEDESVDLAVATGIMHHVDATEPVIREMFRVAKKAVLISDHNNFAFGGSRARKLRLWLHASGMLGLATFLKQGFRKQGYSQEDGWWYPYSLINDYGLISGLSKSQFIIPTRPNFPNSGNLLLTQSHLAILALKVHPEQSGLQTPPVPSGAH